RDRPSLDAVDRSVRRRRGGLNPPRKSLPKEVMPDTRDPQLPLSRYRVLDLTIARAGPTAVRLLSDWGADVTRVEPPPGKDRGSVTGRRRGSDEQNLHRNKRSLCLDLKSSRGAEVLDRLI